MESEAYNPTTVPTSNVSDTLAARMLKQLKRVAGFLASSKISPDMKVLVNVTLLKVDVFFTLGHLAHGGQSKR